jgi:hypothetical protein
MKCQVLADACEKHDGGCCVVTGNTIVHSSKLIDATHVFGVTSHIVEKSLISTKKAPKDYLETIQNEYDVWTCIVLTKSTWDKWFNNHLWTVAVSTLSFLTALLG